jgi:hypothetical protein
MESINNRANHTRHCTHGFRCGEEELEIRRRTQNGVDSNATHKQLESGTTLLHQLTVTLI